MSKSEPNVTVSLPKAQLEEVINALYNASDDNYSYACRVAGNRIETALRKDRKK